MKELEFSIQDIRELMETFCKNGMGSLKIQQGEFCLKMESPRLEQAVGSAPPIVTTAAVVAMPAEQEISVRGYEVTSPIVGTFYASPAPDKPPYVQAGSKVKKGDVLFIIESMKLMNEVISEHDGTIGQIMVENGQGVEYGQPILYIE